MSVEALGFILQPGYRLRRGRAVVTLHGVLAEGGAFLVEDDRFEPYFFAPPEHLERLGRMAGARVESTPLVTLDGRELRRVVVPVPGAVPPLRQSLERTGGEAFEADVRFPYRYLIDHGIRAALRIEGKGHSVRPGVVRFRNPTLHPAEFRPSLSLLSLDIETTPDASRLYSVALVGRNVDEVHLIARRPVPGAVAHADEAALLRALVGRVAAVDPDVLTGWNVVDFDLRVLVRRAQALGVPLTLGRTEGGVRFERDPGFTRQSRASLPGRQVLDGIALVRDAFIPLDDYRLETAAQTLLGRGKRIETSGAERAGEIERLWREDPAGLAAYNREDARLVLDILEREALVELAVERSLLTGMQLDRVGASIASFDLVYLPELRRRGRVAPSVDRARKSARVMGGAVLASHPGFFTNVAVFDFKSLYPSLMRSFNLDPLAHARAGADAVVAPNGARFSREDAILPAIVTRFLERREAAKRRGDRHADFAIKIMMNALFGVLAAASCRFFDPDVANAITSLGQQLLHWTRESFEAEGVRVLYGDTDSVFVELGVTGASQEVEAAALNLRERVQASLAARIRETYRLEPRLELELEHVYTRFFQPTVRRGGQGSKKRYAGLVAGELEIVGLEAVRRDTPAVTRRLQEGILARAFHDRPVAPFVRDVVARVRRGELNAELVIRKGVRKGSVAQYTATTPPHIKAARKAGAEVDRVVRYVIAASGPEPVLPGRPLPADIDHVHYVEKMLRPVAEAILPHLELSFDEIIGAPRQLTLW